jgi:hypothetical protein
MFIPGTTADKAPIETDPLSAHGKTYGGKADLKEFNSPHLYILSMFRKMGRYSPPFPLNPTSRKVFLSKKLTFSEGIIISRVPARMDMETGTYHSISLDFLNLIANLEADTPRYQQKLPS